MKQILPKNAGFSLLEILISLVIMSVGMMGLAGLKIVAIKGTNEAHFRHEASLLMADLADRMRANEAAVDNGTYLAKTPVSIAAEPNSNCGSATCTADQLADYDKYQVAFMMTQAMPGSTLVITCPNDDCSTVNDVKVEHTIAINWKEKKDKSENMITVVDEETIVDEFNNRQIELKITP